MTGGQQAEPKKTLSLAAWGLLHRAEFLPSSGFYPRWLSLCPLQFRLPQQTHPSKLSSPDLPQLCDISSDFWGSNLYPIVSEQPNLGLYKGKWENAFPSNRNSSSLWLTPKETHTLEDLGQPHPRPHQRNRDTDAQVHTNTYRAIHIWDSKYSAEGTKMVEFSGEKTLLMKPLPQPWLQTSQKVCSSASQPITPTRAYPRI